MSKTRRSKLPFVDGRSSEPREALEQATIVASSEGLAWPGVYVEYGRNGPWFVEDLGVQHHYLAVNTDTEPLRFEVERATGFEQVVMLPGAVWFCPAGEAFTHRVPSACSFAALTIEPGRLERLLGEQQVSLVRSYGVVRPQLEHLVRALMAEAERGGPGGPVFVDALAAALSVQLVDAFGVKSGGRVAPRGGLSPGRLRRVLDLLEARLEHGVSIEDMASEARLSPAHFARAFKQATGRAPHQYLLAMRLERARAALAEREPRLLDIALRFGFSDQAHFTRMFRRHFGMTPGELVRQQQRASGTLRAVDEHGSTREASGAGSR